MRSPRCWYLCCLHRPAPSLLLEAEVDAHPDFLLKHVGDLLDGDLVAGDGVGGGGHHAVRALPELVQLLVRRVQRARAELRVVRVGTYSAFHADLQFYKPFIRSIGRITCRIHALVPTGTLAPVNS